MLSRSCSKWLGRGAGAVLAATALATTAHASAPKTCDTLSAADKVVALNDINNLMGKYSHLGVLRGEGTLGELFALKTAGVSWQTPGGPVGIAAMTARLARPDEQLQPGALHMHEMLTPVIEIAGDGKTAKGIWDSFGPNILNADDIGTWFSAKYGVDFVKEDGEWKIWHLRVFGMFNTPYDKSITQSARERRERGQLRDPGSGGVGRPGGGPPPTGPGYVMPPNMWIYNGVSTPQGPRVPMPYCTFDAADSVAYTGK